MKLPRKKSNRRIVPKASERKQRRRVASRLVLMVAALGVLIALPWVVYTAYRQVVESGYFAPATIEVKGQERVGEEELIELSGLRAEDVSLLELEVSEVAERLERHPWIRTARVETDLPDRVVIEVEERELLGLVLVDRLYLVDAQGAIIKPLEASDPRAFMSGVVVSGLEGRLMSGDARESMEARAQVLEAFQMAERYQAMGLTRFAPLLEVNVDEQLGYTLFVAEHGMEVRLGWDRYEERLRRLWQVFEVLKEKEIRAEYALLDLEDDLDRVAIKPIPRLVEPPPPEEPLEQEGGEIGEDAGEPSP